MSAIDFGRTYEESTFLNPLLGGAPDTHRIEVRRDPLTGTRSLYSPRLEGKAFIGPTDHELIERYAKETEARCFICGDRWQKTTPAYPAALLPDGRIQQGEAVLFPNLFPIDAVHAVIRVSALHHVRLCEFSPPMILDALRAAHRFVLRLGAVQSTPFLTIDGNFLFPAGASIAHPHFQVVGGSSPCSWLARQLSACRAWEEAHKSCYYSTLLDEERGAGERFIGMAGPVAWLTAFAPQGTNEIIGLLPDRRSFVELEEEDLSGLALGLSRVLATYHDLGLSTFNFALFSGPIPGGDPGFRCQLRVISRQTVHQSYRTDDYFLQRLMGDELILTTPEALAAELRRRFPSAAA
jgi:UDPglucose--hexose-1-phosphate uridylyltransferase